ncbi:lysine decarboxylase [Salmonella enterica subsp. enterica]|uniref:Lysine decarboxylase n=1 Tax=Salmonella enterica I TaxID=59201 RepID=A0A447PLI4_SALET|nr:lysine decarboxylase [Salmonella enterica subsp. enterica]
MSISVTELGSLLDHTGPHLEAEEYIARTFGAEQSYMVTNGTSTSNKIVGMYAAPAGSTLLIDRNCHKSLAHLLMMSDVVPLWLKPTRNALVFSAVFLSVNLPATALRVRWRKPRRRNGRFMRLSPILLTMVCCITLTGSSRCWTFLDPF